MLVDTALLFGLRLLAGDGLQAQYFLARPEPKGDPVGAGNSVTRGFQQHLLKSLFFYFMFIDLGGEFRVIITPLKSLQGSLPQ
jgi:hypothetical protein